MKNESSQIKKCISSAFADPLNRSNTWRLVKIAEIVSLSRLQTRALAAILNLFPRRACVFDRFIYSTQPVHPFWSMVVISDVVSARLSHLAYSALDLWQPPEWVLHRNHIAPFFANFINHQKLSEVRSVVKSPKESAAVGARTARSSSLPAARACAARARAALTAHQSRVRRPLPITTRSNMQMLYFETL